MYGSMTENQLREMASTKRKQKPAHAKKNIFRLMINKISGEVIYAVMSFGGFLGIGEKLHPVPLGCLQYDISKEAYLVRF